ncbi:DUF3085 domain-containing protein [Rhizobium bangladeshense]|uniref:DUF3085 domain-containing protein n=1 Tax=Rhizobium bangladeshense TaxID=1138189 RepID=UPI0040553D86
MFTFSVVEVSAVIVHGRTDAEANGGFRNPHYGLLPGRTAGSVDRRRRRRLSAVQWQTGRRSKDAECDPQTDPDCWHYKRRYFEGDDGIVFIAGASLEAMLSTTPEPTHLRAQFTSETMQFSVVTRS